MNKTREIQESTIDKLRLFIVRKYNGNKISAPMKFILDSNVNEFEKYLFHDKNATGEKDE